MDSLSTLIRFDHDIFLLHFSLNSCAFQVNKVPFAAITLKPQRVCYLWGVCWRMSLFIGKVQCLFCRAISHLLHYFSIIFLFEKEWLLFDKYTAYKIWDRVSFGYNVHLQYDLRVVTTMARNDDHKTAEAYKLSDSRLTNSQFT